jgi:hypothetical protein
MLTNPSLDSRSGLASRSFSPYCLPIILACTWLYTLLDRLGGGPHLRDIDDALRAIEVTRFFEYGGWYDLTLPMIQMPEPYVSPWSRLVDLPYVLIARVLTLFGIAPPTALHWSFKIWPPMMLAAFCTLAFSIIQSFCLSKSAARPSTIIAIALCMFPMCGEFTPGRIDHHNLQIVLLTLMLAGLVRSSVAGGMISGVAVALSLAIGLECVPIIAGIFGSLVIAWLAGMPASRRLLCSAMVSAAVATPIAALVLIGPVGMSSTQCDAFSAPYVYITTASCLTVAIAVWFTGDESSAWRKIASVAIPAIVIAAGFVWWFPKCLAGPYAIIDPVSRHFWFDRIEQEHSVVTLFVRHAIPQVVLVTVLTVGLLLALPGVVSRARSGRIQELIVFAGAASTLVMTLLLTRFINFADALVPLLLPLAVDAVASAGKGHRMGRIGLWTALFGPVAVAVLLFVFAPPDLRQFDTIDIMDHDDCTRGNLSALSLQQPGRIIAPSGLSMTLARSAPPGFAVAGIRFHRASPGLRRSYLAFTSADSSTRREAMAPFDYVAVCRSGLALDPEQAPLFEALANGRSWPGLIPLDSGSDNAFKLFRIDHDQLQ